MSLPFATRAERGVNSDVGEGGVISDKIYFCDPGARLGMWNYQLFVQNCTSQLAPIVGLVRTSSGVVSDVKKKANLLR